MLQRLIPYAYLISVMVFPVQHRVNFQPCCGTAKCNVSSCAELSAVKCRGFSYSSFYSALSAGTGGRTRENARLGTGVLVAVLHKCGTGQGVGVCPAVKWAVAVLVHTALYICVLASFTMILQCHYFPFTAFLSVFFPFEMMLDI